MDKEIFTTSHNVCYTTQTVEKRLVLIIPALGVVFMSFSSPLLKLI